MATPTRPGPDPAGIVTVPEVGGGGGGGGAAPDPPIRLDHFTIGRRLGAGGMGLVFEARDTALDRTVALKLVRPDASGDTRRSTRARARLVREAQALARLKHPNVVTVFEVGAAEGEIFIAMELVEGETLRDWLRAAPRPWREVVDVFLAVGRGLAAAHALGLVHRDVKPSNILLERDGTPKIGDFGLVSAADGDGADVGVDGGADVRADGDRDADDGGRDGDGDGDGGRADDRAAATAPGARGRGARATPAGAVTRPTAAPRSSLTTVGAVMGTPAYMAPEQVAGERVDARADQYAFCVSLIEALTGELPGAPGARPIPPRLRPILARGTAPEPAARYPSMTALLAALAVVRRGRARVWAAAGLALGAIALGGGVWLAARAPAADPCPAPAAQLAPVWGAARRDALAAHLRAVDPALGAARAAVVLARGDGFTARWRAMSIDACRATRVAGTQSDTLLDLRTRCLARRLGALDDALALIAGATDVRALDGAVAGLAVLPPLDDCADAAGLAAASPPPDQPAARATAAAIVGALDGVAARAHAGALDGLPAAAAALVDRARALGHGPTLAAALVGLARVELAVADSARAEAALHELTDVAARSHDDRDEAFAWSTLCGLAAERGALDEARALERAASAAVLRAGDPVDLRADLIYQASGLSYGTPDAAAGRAQLEQARALLEGAGAARPDSPLGPRLADVLLERSNFDLRLGAIDDAIAGYRKAIALYQALYGPDSPDEAWGWHDLGEALRRAARPDEAVAALETAVRIRRARLGPSAALMSSLSSLGEAQLNAKHTDAALASAEESQAVATQVLGADAPQLVFPLALRARALGRLGRRDEAIAIYDDVIARTERAGQGGKNLAIFYFGRGELEARAGRCARALPDLEHARAGFEALGGGDLAMQVSPLEETGWCLLELHRPADALVPLGRAVALDGGALEARDAAMARFWLARARVESGVDRARGLADARPARDAVAAAGGSDDLLAQMDAWLKAHGR